MATKGQKALSGAASGAAMGTAIMPGWGTAIGGVAGGLMGLLGGDDEDGMEDYYKALEIINAVEAPNFDPKDLTPEQIQFMGNFMPDLYQSLDLGEQAMVQDQGAANQAELEALNRLGEISRGGPSLADKLALQQANDATNRQVGAGRNAIQESFRNRGMGGGAMEMAQQLNLQRDAQRNASEQAAQAAAAQELKALQALSQYGTMANAMRSRNVQTSTANAGILNNQRQLNWQNTQNNMNKNTATKNDARLRNLDTQQNLAQLNTGIVNTGKTWRTQAARDLADFNLRKAAAAAGQYNAVGGAKDANAAAGMSQMNSLMNMGGQLAAAKIGQGNAPAAAPALAVDKKNIIKNYAGPDDGDPYKYYT